MNWTKSCVIFIAPEITKYRQNALFGLKDKRMQFYEVHLYKNAVLVLNEIKPPDRREFIKKGDRGKRLSKVIKVYNEDDLLNKADDNVKELYYQLRSNVKMLGSDIDVKPTKTYIAFRRRQGFLGIVVRKSKLQAYLNIGINQFRDPLHKARDVKDIGHLPPGKTEITITKNDEIPFVLDLVKQAYEKS